METMEISKRDQDPVREVVGLRDTISGLFDDFFSGRPMLAGRSLQTDNGFGWTPAVDIRETRDEIIVCAGLSGVEREDIQLEVKDNTLVLSGQRREPKEEEGWIRRELPCGPFYRAFSLPSEVVSSQVKAHFKNGVLEIHLPKPEQAKPHKVQIS